MDDGWQEPAEGDGFGIPQAVKGIDWMSHYFSTHLLHVRLYLYVMRIGGHESWQA